MPPPSQLGVWSLSIPRSSIPTAQRLYDAAIAAGASPTTALYLVGSAYQESGFNVRATGDNGSSVGLMQVNPALMRQWQAQGVDVSDPVEQMTAYIAQLQRMAPGTWSAMQQASNPVEVYLAQHSNPDFRMGIPGARFNYANQLAETLNVGSAGGTTDLWGGGAAQPTGLGFDSRIDLGPTVGGGADLSWLYGNSDLQYPAFDAGPMSQGGDAISRFGGDASLGQDLNADLGGLYGNDQYGPGDTPNTFGTPQAPALSGDEFAGDTAQGSRFSSVDLGPMEREYAPFYNFNPSGISDADFNSWPGQYEMPAGPSDLSQMLSSAMGYGEIDPFSQMMGFPANEGGFSTEDLGPTYTPPDLMAGLGEFEHDPSLQPLDLSDYGAGSGDTGDAALNDYVDALAQYGGYGSFGYDAAGNIVPWSEWTAEMADNGTPFDTADRPQGGGYSDPFLDLGDGPVQPLSLRPGFIPSDSGLGVIFGVDGGPLQITGGGVPGQQVYFNGMPYGQISGAGGGFVIPYGTANPFGGLAGVINPGLMPRGAGTPYGSGIGDTLLGSLGFGAGLPAGGWFRPTADMRPETGRAAAIRASIQNWT